MRGLMRIQNRLNRIEAWADWNRLAATAPEMAARFAPSATAGARTIDKRIAALSLVRLPLGAASPPTLRSYLACSVSSSVRAFL